MRIIINESQYDQLSESKMRAWKYIDAINSISNDIIDLIAASNGDSDGDGEID